MNGCDYLTWWVWEYCNMTVSNQRQQIISMLLYIYIYIYIYIYHHVTLVAWISLTLSRHSSLSFIALGRSSGQHPVSSHSC